MDKTELKNVILDLFEQQRELYDRIAEKDKMIATLSEKIDILIASQNQINHDLEAWQAKERQWNEERQALLQLQADLIKDLNKIMK